MTSVDVTDPATRGRNLQMGHREPTNLQGFGVTCIARRKKRRTENSLLRTVTSYTAFDDVTVSANARTSVHSTSTNIT